MGLHLFMLPPLRHSPIIQKHLPLFIPNPGYVSWLVIPGLMCISVSWCVFSHHLLAMQRFHPLSSLPLSPFPSSLCFPVHMFQWKKTGFCQNPSFLLSALSTFFKVGCHRNSVSPDTPVVLKMSKQVCVCVAFPVFTWWCSFYHVS